jgi:hypothetical protein
VNFFIDSQEGRSTLHPTNVLLYGWVGGEHACVNFTGVSPHVGLGVGDFTVRQTTLKVASSKMGNMGKRVLTKNIFLYLLYLIHLAF